MRQPLAQPSRRNTLVSFANADKIVHVLHISDYSPEEIASTWYDRQEMKAIKSDGKLLLSRVLGGYTPTLSDGSVRGLEAFARERCMEKKQNKINAREAVLCEQSAQREAGVNDPELLADVYFDATEHCQVAAQMMAIRDAFDAAHQQASSEQQARTAFARKNASIMGISAVAQNPPDSSCHVQVSSSAA